MSRKQIYQAQALAIWREVPTVLALFAILNLSLALFSRRFDGNWLWIGMRYLKTELVFLLLAAFAISVLGYAWFGKRGQIVSRIIVAMVGLACLYNSYEFYQLLWQGNLTSELPIPISLVLAIALLSRSIRPPCTQNQRRLARLIHVATAALLCLSLQLHLFGTTDYRRQADAIIVFGAGLKEDGTPSLVLQNRLDTACRLYQQGLAQYLVFSGGRNPSRPLSEPQAMRRAAIEQGIPASCIILDETGVNTRATAINTLRISNARGWQRLLIVSHDYHLSRIKLCFHRMGIKAYTVPARQSYPQILKIRYFSRELFAWVYYYLNG